MQDGIKPFLRFGINFKSLDSAEIWNANISSKIPANKQNFVTRRTLSRRY